MIFTVTRIEKVLKSGTSKTGNPYSLDFTNVTVSVPVNDANQFGSVASKDTTYQYGSASNFSNLEALRGCLPVEMDLTMGVEMDAYGNAKTVITEMKALPSATPQTNK